MNNCFGIIRKLLISQNIKIHISTTFLCTKWLAAILKTRFRLSRNNHLMSTFVILLNCNGICIYNIYSTVVMVNEVI